MFIHYSDRALSITGYGDLSKSAAYITQRAGSPSLSCASCFRQIRVGLDLDKTLGQIRICPDPLPITSICNGLRHRTQQIVSMLGLFHMRCRNARNGNRQLLFLHSRMQSLLARQPDAHVIIKTHGVSSEAPVKDTYPLQLSE